jgi:hypothetical protein
VAIDITEAVTLVRSFARNAGGGATSQYDDDEIERFIMFVGDDFVRHTKCTRRVDNFSIVAAASGVVFTSILSAGFLAERSMRAWIPNKGRLQITDHGTLVDRQIKSQSAALPTIIAFDSQVTAEVDPIPALNYTAKIQWWAPFVSWIPGSASPTFNLPDDYLRVILAGAGARLQINEKENKQAIDAWKEYLAARDDLVGFGTWGSTSADRDMLPES